MIPASAVAVRFHELSVVVDQRKLQLVPYHRTTEGNKTQFSVAVAPQEPRHLTLCFFPAGFLPVAAGPGASLEALPTDASIRAFRSCTDACSGSTRRCCPCACVRAPGTDGFPVSCSSCHFSVVLVEHLQIAPSAMLGIQGCLIADIRCRGQHK